MQKEIVRLGDIATYINGYPFKPSQWKTQGLPIIRIQNLNNSLAEFNYTDEGIPDKYRVSKGDILISWSASIGVYEWQGPVSFVNQHIFKVDFNKMKINKIYFKYVVNKALEKALQYTHGSTMKHFTKGYFDAIEINIPPLAIQDKITRVLDKVQQLIDKRKKQIKACDELVKSLFYHVFGDVKSNAKGFEESYIENISVKITDGDHATPKRESEGVKLLSARNVKNSFIDFEAGLDFVGIEEYERMAKRCKPEFGDILISCSGTIGRVTKVHIQEPFVLVRSVALIKLRTEKVNPVFLEHCLQTQYLQAVMNKSANKSGQANLFNNQIKRLPVFIPHLDLQNKFAEQVEKIEQQKQKLQQSLTELENNFNALMQRAFKGELF